MGASIYDVARHTGLSIATVSRVLNHSSAVRPATVEKVEQAMRELNYTANRMAKGLAQKRSGLVGVLVPEISGLSTTYITECLAGIGEALEPEGNHIVLLYEHNNGAEAALDGMRQHLLDGVLALHAAAAQRFGAALDDPACRIGYIGKPEQNGACNVYANYQEYVPQIMRELHAAGHERVLFVSNMEFNYRQVARQLDENRQQLFPHWICYRECPEKTESAWPIILKEIIRQAVEEGCTAVYTDAAMDAGQVLAVCRELELDVPQQLSLVTVEHHETESSLVAPGVDHYSIPARVMGRTLAQMVLRRIGGEVREERAVINGKYVRCGSVRILK